MRFYCMVGNAFFMNKLIVSVFVGLLFANIFFACQEDHDDFSDSPNDLLAFSHDTLSFDTLFSTIGSTTKKIMIYNRNKKALKIQSIQLMGAGNSGFRINVDGRMGSLFSDVEIQAQDSLFLFVETTAAENQDTQPIIIMDSIQFVTNTVRQQVILQAYGQDAYIYKGGMIIESDSILNNDKPILLYDSLVVRPDISLTIPEGTTLYLHDKARLDIYGKLIINGSVDKPVTIRGDRLDKVLNISYDKQPGQWQGIYFHTDSYDNEIHHARIRNGYYGIVCDSSDVAQSKLKISNTVLSNVYNNLLEATHSRVEVENSELSNAGGALLYLTGGSYSFTHCTMANYFTWSSRLGASVQLGNYQKQGETVIPLPLQKADFLNCIIYGLNTKEIQFNNAGEEEHPGIGFAYKFDYCLLKMDYKDLNTSQVSNYKLNEDPKFRTIDRDTYSYDYRLQQGSPAIDAGSSAYLLSPDLYNTPRPQGTAPDPGAYEWTSTD